MALNKEDKVNIFKVIKLLGLPKEKPEFSDKAQEIKFSWVERTPTEILENIDSKDLDEKLLRKLAEQVFSFT